MVEEENKKQCTFLNVCFLIADKFRRDIVKVDLDSDHGFDNWIGYREENRRNKIVVSLILIENRYWPCTCTKGVWYCRVGMKEVVNNNEERVGLAV